MSYKKILLLISFVSAINCSCQNLSPLFKDKVIDNSIKVTIYTESPTKTVSPYLSGFNVSYYKDSGTIWEDNDVAQYLSDVKSGMLRFPGGAETSYYHWEYPGCWGYKDAWNEGHGVDLEDAVANSLGLMDIDKYIEWCRVIGNEPLVGVNLKSGFYLDVLEEKSLPEALRLLTHCNITNDYDVKYWFLDNELNHSQYIDVSVEEYAEAINLFVPAMKAIDPDIKIVVNLINKGWSPNWETLLSLAADNIDVCDLHYYYTWGEATWDTWLTDTPMKVENLAGNTFITDVSILQGYIDASSNPDIKIGSFEWNIGPVPDGEDAISLYKQMVMQTEMFQQFVDSDLEMACVWPLLWGTEARGSLLDQITYEPAPLYYLYSLYVDALGGILVPDMSSDTRIMAQAIASQDGKDLYVFLLNKSSYDVEVGLDTQGVHYSSGEGDMIYSDDLESKSCSTKECDVEIDGDIAYVTIPAYSVVRALLHK